MLLKIESLKPKYSIIKPTLYINTFNMAAVQESTTATATEDTAALPVPPTNYGRIGVEHCCEVWHRRLPLAEDLPLLCP